jgi:hypothetical protein
MTGMAFPLFVRSIVRYRNRIAQSDGRGADGELLIHPNPRRLDDLPPLCHLGPDQRLEFFLARGTTFDAFDLAPVRRYDSGSRQTL